MKKLLVILSILICGSAQAKTIYLTTYNNCVLDDEVSDQSMRDLKSCLAEKVSKRGLGNYPIYLYINSPGGSIYSGLKFIQFAKTIPNLHTVNSFAASMAAAIIQGLPGRRYSTDGSISMFHRARGSFSGQFGSGELESRLKMWQKIVLDMEKMQARRIGISLNSYQANRQNEWWLYGSDNVKENVSDEEVSVGCSRQLMSLSEEYTVNTFIGTITYTKSLCPLLN